MSGHIGGDAPRKPRENDTAVARGKVPPPLSIVPAGAKAAQAR
jgi:hypothetical protein